MHRIIKIIAVTPFSLFVPLTASAQLATGGGAGPFEDLLKNILNFSNEILIQNNALSYKPNSRINWLAGFIKQITGHL